MHEDRITYRKPSIHEEYETTTNRTVYDKLHKEIHATCAYCHWHRGDNATHKGTHSHHKINKIRYPSHRVVIQEGTHA